MAESDAVDQDGPSQSRRRRGPTVRFVPRFPAREITSLAKANASDEREAAALAAGRRLASGRGDRRDFEAIYEWKTRGRGRSRLAQDTDAEVADVLRLATIARTERGAVAVLTGLSGVDVPVASAVMTAMDPARYTILDFRALWSLGIERSNYTYGFYLEYLAECRRIAAAADTDLRTLDKALWQYSREHQPPSR